MRQGFFLSKMVNFPLCRGWKAGPVFHSVVCLTGTRSRCPATALGQQTVRWAGLALREGFRQGLWHWIVCISQLLSRCCWKTSQSGTQWVTRPEFMLVLMVCSFSAVRLIQNGLPERLCCGSARQGSWLQEGFRSIPCVILGSRLKRQCYPRHVLLVADRWMQNSSMPAHWRPLLMLHLLTLQWSKKATRPRSISMGQDVYSIHSERV